jgi:hypothetical protein
MRPRGADFDDEWRGDKLEFHALADALTKQHPKRNFSVQKNPFRAIGIDFLQLLEVATNRAPIKAN